MQFEHLAFSGRRYIDILWVCKFMYLKMVTENIVPVASSRLPIGELYNLPSLALTTRPVRKMRSVLPPCDQSGTPES
jgi:hypothetical protein